MTLEFDYKRDNHIIFEFKGINLLLKSFFLNCKLLAIQNDHIFYNFSPKSCDLQAIKNI
jgi:hypothetical protein